MEPWSSESGTNIEVDFSLPPSVSMPLWRSLYLNLRDRFKPERLPALHLTAKPVEVGMLLGDLVDLPWYRTVFTSIGDVISPETMPPLELESRPVDVGELLSDQMQHGWWTSLLRNLADNMSPERLPVLDVTSAPVKPEMASSLLMVPRWSNLISGPKVFLPESSRPIPVAMRFQTLAAEPAMVPVEVVSSPEEYDYLRDVVRQTRRSLRHSRLREAIWVLLAAAEVGYLVFHFFVP